MWRLAPALRHQSNPHVLARPARQKEVTRERAAVGTPALQRSCTSKRLTDGRYVSSSIIRTNVSQKIAHSSISAKNALGIIPNRHAPRRETPPGRAHLQVGPADSPSQPLSHHSPKGLSDFFTSFQGSRAKAMSAAAFSNCAKQKGFSSTCWKWTWSGVTLMTCKMMKNGRRSPKEYGKASGMPSSCHLLAQRGPEQSGPTSWGRSRYGPGTSDMDSLGWLGN